jgi:hypothetical protein
MIQRFPALVAGFEFFRFARQLLVGQRLHLGLQGVDLVGNLEQGLELRVVAQAKAFFKNSSMFFLL